MKEADRQRLEQTIETLASYTEAVPSGVQRISYSDEYKEAQQYLVKRMKELDMEVNVDPIGNLMGVLKGSEDLKKIMSGSHLDSVRNAGKYDGAAGIVAALEVAEMLKEEGRKLRHPYQIICTVGEEGTRFNQTLLGSQFFCGIHGEKQLNSFTGFDGRTLQETLESYDLEQIAPVIASHTDDIACMIELHGEQGPILEREHQTIGVVEYIAGIVWLEVSISGFSNHAGTVPMNMRQDAGIEAYKAILEIDSYVKEKYCDKATLTIGQLNLSPGSSNCIPGQCIFTVDIRSGSKTIMEDITRMIHETLQECERNGFETDIRKLNEKEPTAMDVSLQKLIEASCKETSISYRYMDSGAGHDSMIFASQFPTAMIFVPNVRGISHNPEELILSDDLKQGTDILYRTICKLDETE
ncbi:MAG: M20 family metallo-hydrolase [Erysipelotrichaceae bacterium]|nr:M20 family metallo-hydrolase [Erysipelotrichaceae bacterium]